MSSQEQENRYRVENEGAEDQIFACNICDYKQKKEGTMKSHYTRQHTKKSGKEDSTKPAETEEEALAALEEWNRPPREDEDEEVDDEIDEEEDLVESAAAQQEVVVINDSNGQEGNLEQAVARIKHLEEEGAAKEELLKKMETELETAKDLASIAEGQVASLEVD